MSLRLDAAAGMINVQGVLETLEGFWSLGNKY